MVDVVDTDDAGAVDVAVVEESAPAAVVVVVPPVSPVPQETTSTTDTTAANKIRGRITMTGAYRDSSLRSPGARKPPVQSLTTAQLPAPCRNQPP